MLKRILPNSQPLGDIPTINVKDNQDFFSNFFTDNFYLGISTSRFPTALKKTEVKPVFKKRIIEPVNLLPVISKVYERLIY